MFKFSVGQHVRFADWITADHLEAIELGWQIEKGILGRIFEVLEECQHTIYSGLEYKVLDRINGEIWVVKQCYLVAANPEDFIPRSSRFSTTD